MQSANTETRQTSAVTVERGHHHELQGRLEKKFAPMDRKLFPPVCLVGRRAFLVVHFLVCSQTTQTTWQSQVGTRTLWSLLLFEFYSTRKEETN